MIPQISSSFLPRAASWLVLSLALAGFAQAPVAGQPGPNLPVPEQTNVPQNAPLDPNLPTIFIVGDSTARNKADLGWGDHFAHYFDTTKVNVANRAIAGRSARSYMNEGAWDKVLAEMKPGDYVLLQWGHNDGGGPLTPDFKGRGEGKGIGEESAEVPIAMPYKVGPLAGKTTETIHTYGWYNRKYIADTRAKGATPMLLTVTIRNIWTVGPDGKQHIERDMGYRDYDFQIAAAEHVPIADMATVEADYLEPLGPEKTAVFFPVDHTHTSAEGAGIVAGAVIESLYRIDSRLVNPFPVEEGNKDSMIGPVYVNENAASAHFAFDAARMAIVAQNILAGNGPKPAQPNGGRGDFLKLPEADSFLSQGGEVAYWHKNKGEPCVLFFTFRGILDSFAGYVFTQSGRMPDTDSFLGQPVEIIKVAPNWFWYRSRN
jgi:rhamnogalacturonan acetylesterase